MDLLATVDEEEALRNIQTQGENLIDGTVGEIERDESDEAVAPEDGGIAGNNNRGDEGVLEGVAVGGIDVYSSDSDEEEDTGIVIHAGRATSAAPRRHTPHFDRSSKVYLRPQALTPAGPVSYENVEELPTKIPVKDETKRLRFTHHRTAFDVDIDNLESHPWRNKNVDLSDYFNYGFSEATWQLYSERQLLLRGRLGLAPYHPPPVVASVPSKVDSIVVPTASSSVISSTPAIAFVPPLAISYPTAPTPISAPLPHLIMPPARPTFIAPLTVVAPPILVSQPPPPYRVPVNIPTSELYAIPTAPVPAPPVYPHTSVPPSSYIQPPTWPGMPGTMPNIPGMPPINMMGVGRGWDPHGAMPPQHAHAAYGFPGPGGMMGTYGIQGVMPMGLIPMDGQGPGFDGPRMDMSGYQDHMYRGEDIYSGNGVDGWGNDQNRRQRRQESVFQSSADGKLSEGPKEVESRGEKVANTRSRSRDRMSRGDRIEPEARDRLERSRDNIEKERGRTDDGMRGEKRRRDDGDDRRDLSAKTGRERDRELDRNSRGGDLDKRGRR